MKIDIKKYDRMMTARDFFKDCGNVYFVGGCIRDIILKQEPHDFDLISDQEPEEIQKYIQSKGKRCYLMGAKFGTMSCKLDGEMYEITTFRKEEYTDGSRKPKVEYTKNIIEDLKRRDFTINTLVCNMEGEVKNHMGGLEDLYSKTLKCVGVAKHRFKEDPLRILRGIRFAAKYDLVVEDTTAKRIESCRFELYKISKERIKDEIDKMLLLETPLQSRVSMFLLFHYKTWQIVYPPMQLQYKYAQNSPHHHFVLHKHSCMVVYAIKHDPILKSSLTHLWAGLLHDIAKPFTQSWHKSGERCNYISHEIIGAQMSNDFCIKYKFSNKDREFIVQAVEEHLQPEFWLKKFDDAGKLR